MERTCFLATFSRIVKIFPDILCPGKSVIVTGTSSETLVKEDICKPGMTVIANNKVKPKPRYGL